MKVTISGFPGAGKGTLRKLLEKEYNIPSFSVGDLRREYAKKEEMTIQELNAKGIEYDIKADKYQIEWANKKKKFILEGRLSYHFIPESIRIFLDVDSKIGAKRILKENRNSEKKCNSLEEQIKINKERCESDNQRYLEAHGIKDCYNENNFDIIIDTSNRTPEQVRKLVKIKIFDYNQKMNPPKFYLAHPTESRKEIRKWEKEFEKRTGIELVNPFFDCDTLETKLEDIGKEKYLGMGKDVTHLYKGDLEQIARKDVLGGVIILDDNWTWGTPAEQGTIWLMSKLIYTVDLNQEKSYFNHPVVRFYSGENVFESKEKLEEFLVKNKNNFFRDLERVRRNTSKDPTYKIIYDEIKKNKEYLGK